MKCSTCGTDLKERAVCEKCGKKAGTVPSPDSIEVEYKDFKISEFLEIRPKYGAAKELERTDYEKAGPSADATKANTFSRIIPIVAVIVFAAAVIYLFYRLSLL